jgi:hypothetical protein
VGIDDPATGRVITTWTTEQGTREDKPSVAVHWQAVNANRGTPVPKGSKAWISDHLDPFNSGRSSAPYFSNERAFDEYCLVSGRTVGHVERSHSV